MWFVSFFLFNSALLHTNSKTIEPRDVMKFGNTMKLDILNIVMVNIAHILGKDHILGKINISSFFSTEAPYIQTDGIFKAFLSHSLCISNLRIKINTNQKQTLKEIAIKIT